MRKSVYTILILVLLAKDSFAQLLPPVAQALYDEAVDRDPMRVKYAVDNNARVLPTTDGNSFYIKWFPPGVEPAGTALIVTLHGSNGFAFDEFFLWHKIAREHGCGIIALQWYRGKKSAKPNDYFPDETIYGYIDSALSALHYPSQKALLHGFSRGAARSYAIAFYDVHSGKNYFAYIMSNSGAAMQGYPLYARINSGIYGAGIFSGKRWGLFCGGLDPNPGQSGCTGMNNTKTWLESLGATIDVFIQDKTAGHGGFHQSSVYMDSVLNNYKSWFSRN